MSFERANNGSTFLAKWVIENFTFSKDDEVLTSSKFGDFLFELCVIPKKDFLLNGFYCSLEIVDLQVNLYDMPPISYEISILVGDGSYRRVLLETNVFLQDLKTIGIGIVDKGFVHERDIVGMLKENTLTLCCRIWCREEIFKPPFQWLLRTRITTQKQTYKLKVRKDEAFFQQEFVCLFPDYLARFKWIDEGLTGQMLEIGVKLNDGRHSKRKVACMLHVLDSTGNSVVSQEGKFHFSDQHMGPLAFPAFLVSKIWLSGYGDKWLVNDTLNLWVEIEMSDGDTVEEVEKVHFGDPSEYFAEGLDFVIDTNKDSSTATNPLTSGLLSLYEEQRFCDVTIQTPNSSFPVHKAILCAQSPVFAAMFERDMEEKRTGIVKIPDLADDTIRQMLLFMYTNTVKDLDWESALALFLTADRFGILTLKLMCKNILKAKLSVANVTNALLLVNLQNDDDWKSAVYQFILERDSEIITSDMWKKFIQDHTKLAADAMHVVYLQKLRKESKT